MQNYYRFIIPRLDGPSLKEDFPRYVSLVKKGVAGFILFGGEVEQARHFIQRLQAESELPLIIAADLERGLGQQLEGGTPLPPAMALAKATRRGRSPGAAGRKGRSADLLLLRKTFKTLAEEARYAGINVILAPVLDINTNPKNPIICTRSFGEDGGTVSFFGCEMIKAVQALGIAACAKHFPGHGDTSVDSHISLPVIERGLDELQKKELRPFARAVQCGVEMIMLGHLSVPAVDPSGIPLSISQKAVLYLRKNMKYKGLLITDAMNMGGLGGYSEEKASFEAVSAGVDLLLHPSDTEKIVSYFRRRKAVFDGSRLEKFRRRLPRMASPSPPAFAMNRRLSRLLAKKAITTSGRFEPGSRPFLLILNDEDDERGSVFSRRLREHVPGSASLTLTRGSEVCRVAIPAGRSLVVAVFSETKAWKGGVSEWLHRQIDYLKDRADLFVSFGSPYLFDMIADTPKMFVYWDSDSSQAAAAYLIAKRCHPPGR
jgi:beta-glucosidase-like glycosyl hydrolase